MLLAHLLTQKASQEIHNGLHVYETPSSEYLVVAPVFDDIQILNPASSKIELHIIHLITHQSVG